MVFNDAYKGLLERNNVVQEQCFCHIFPEGRGRERRVMGQCPIIPNIQKKTQAVVLKISIVKLVSKLHFRIRT